MLKLITLAEYEANHSVTSSGSLIVDMYWLFVQYKLYNITICKNISFNAIEDSNIVIGVFFPCYPVRSIS